MQLQVAVHEPHHIHEQIFFIGPEPYGSPTTGGNSNSVSFRRIVKLSWVLLGVKVANSGPNSQQ
ncbi:hypothetical protein RchiOBHm_Chr6g0264321 [Rosa chinensis]|uniref:Uncharacterized protein n=1 Tax=Rosa chinensis TaxID=74649 RepID=A0A2P6PP67_ROSCH|nr:hypothetical protein RchiOBHm_Chr6g0264321 [Rosa chinensis]